MNRQLRRATEKSDKKREKERGKRRGARQAARHAPRQAPRQTKPQPKKAEADAEPRTEKTARQQRWAGIYIVMTVVIIGVQAVLPEQEMDTLALVIHGLFYLTFGYFLASWLFRRGTPQALPLALGVGALLAAGVELAKFARPDVSADPTLLYVALPGLLLGALLSRFVYVRTG